MLFRTSFSRATQPCYLTAGLLSAIISSSALAQQGEPSEDAGAQTLRLPGAEAETENRSPTGEGTLQLPEAPVVQVQQAAPKDGEAKLQTVREREHPELAPYGIDIGSFKLSASANAGLGYDSNIFGRSGGPGDGFALLGADMKLQSNWRRHSLELSGTVTDRIHATYATEDGVSYRLATLGTLDLSRDDAISAELSHERVVSRRGSITEIEEGRRPTRYDRDQAAVSAKAGFGRLSTRLSAEVADYSYVDDPLLAGTPADTRFRDYTRWSIGAELGYEVAPSKSVFVAARRSYLRYRFDAEPRRDADVSEFVVGIRSDISPVLRGRVGAGYIVANFSDPAVKDDKGPTIDADLDWLVTELTTVHLSANRTLENASSANSPSRLKTSAQITIDHELLRNLILSADAGYDTIDYSLTEKGADQYRLGLSATWTPNRNLQIVGGVDGRRRNTSGFTTPQSYSAIEATVSMRFRL